MKQIISCSIFNLKQWTSSHRPLIVFLMGAAYILYIISPLRNACSNVGAKCSPWLMPFILSDNNSILILMVTYVLLICDAPFLYPYQKYLIVRVGKITWCCGQIFYIFVATLVYWILIVLFAVIALVPELEYSSTWGIVINTLSQTGTLGGINIPFDFDYKIVLYFSPHIAFCVSFCMAVLVSFTLGMVILRFNMEKNKNLGSIIALLLILFQSFAPISSGYWFYKISPISWISMEIVNYSNQVTNMPNAICVLCVLLSLVIILIITAIVKIKKNANNILL